MTRSTLLLVLTLLLPVRLLAQPTTTCRPNIFGGQDCDTPAGPVTSQPNIFGGQDYQLPDGRRVTSQPNIFGGQDYEGDGAIRAPMVQDRDPEGDH